MLLGVTGIVNIVAYPGIFRAFDPSRAVLCALYINSCICGIELFLRVCAHKEIRLPCRCSPGPHRLRGDVREVCVSGNADEPHRLTFVKKPWPVQHALDPGP